MRDRLIAQLHHSLYKNKKVISRDNVQKALPAFWGPRVALNTLSDKRFSDTKKYVKLYIVWNIQRQLERFSAKSNIFRYIFKVFFLPDYVLFFHNYSF